MYSKLSFFKLRYLSKIEMFETHKYGQLFCNQIIESAQNIVKLKPKCHNKNKTPASMFSITSVHTVLISALSWHSSCHTEQSLKGCVCDSVQVQKKSEDLNTTVNIYVPQAERSWLLKHWVPHTPKIQLLKDCSPRAKTKMTHHSRDLKHISQVAPEAYLV